MSAGGVVDAADQQELKIEREKVSTDLLIY